MNNNENYALGGACLKAKKAGFKFCKAENSYKKCHKWITDEVAKMKEAPSFYQTVIAILAVLVAIGLGYLEAYNCSQGVSSMGTADSTSFYIGWIICCAGLIAGEELGEGLRNIQKEEFSGRWKLNARLVGGGVLTIIYLASQFYISYTAYSESGSSFFVVVYVMLISLFELLVGAVFLKRSLMTIGILFVRLVTKFFIRNMNRYSEQTEKWWQRYLFDIAKATISVTPIEEPEQVRRARNYYNSGGISDDPIINHA